MKIAFILPSLAHTGPILVARDIVDFIHDKVDVVHVYYFDAIEEVTFACNTYRIDFNTPIAFQEYDVVHSHMYRPDKYLAKYASSIDAITISTVHCDIRRDLYYNYNLFVSLVFRYVWLSYFKKMDRLVMISNSLYEGYYKQKIKSQKVSVIPNGRTLKAIHPVPDEHNLKLNTLKQQYKLIGSCALLTKRKGLHLVIEALPHLPDYAFVIVGDGKEMKALQLVAKKHGVEERCLFLGFQKGAESYLPYFDVYAMPSLYEGFGLALIEATLLKKSCVCSSIPVFKELFNSEEVTFFESNNVPSLAEAIRKAYAEKDSRSEKAYHRSIREYTLEKMGQHYFHLYQQLIS